jgi:hypothetical protein
MRSAGGEIVVAFIGVSEFSVCKCGFNRSAKDLRGNYRRNLLPAVVLSKLDRHTSGGKLGAGNHGGDCVEDVVLGLLHDVVRECAVASLSHVSAELLHHRTDDWADAWAGFLGEGRRQVWKRCGGGNPRCVLQQPAPGQARLADFTRNSWRVMFGIHVSTCRRRLENHFDCELNFPRRRSGS